MIKRAFILGLVLALSGVASAQSGLEGRVGVRWDMHTRANSAAADYQALRGYVRLATEATGRYATRFHLDARGKKGIEERVRDRDNPFANRARVQQAYMETAPGGARLLVGRHYVPLRGISAYAVDGLSVERTSQTWSARATGGLQAAFWQPNAPVDGDVHQWGGEIEWHPTARPVRLRSALLRDLDTAGRSRLRVGLDGVWQVSKTVSGGARVEVDPRDNEVWAGHAQASYRLGRRGHVRFAYAQRLVSPHPVFAGGELVTGGRMHSFNTSASLRWPGTASARFGVRVSRGARELRSERLHISWHRLPFVRWRLQFGAHDSWSPWRRIAQGSLALSGAGPKRVHFTFGVKQSFFKWNTSRRPEWRNRTRPHVQLRYTARAGWGVQFKVEEIIDEFAHVRTRATLGLSHRL